MIQTITDNTNSGKIVWIKKWEPFSMTPTANFGNVTITLKSVRVPMAYNMFQLTVGENVHIITKKEYDILMDCIMTSWQ